MLHAARPPPHAWPVMSHPGHDLLIQQPHLGAGPLQPLNGAHHPGLQGAGGHDVNSLMGHNVQNMVGHHLPPGPNGAFGNANSFYNPYHGHQIFPNSSYSNVHASPRPSSRGTESISALSDQGALRHPSGGSVGSPADSAGSPEEGRLANVAYKQSVIRSSIDQRNCTTAETAVGSPAAAGGPHTPYRMQPPSPAASQLPQKSPFDMTTMGMSKAKPDYPHNSQNSSPGHNSSAFTPAGNRPVSVIPSVQRMSSSPYQSPVIKTEPGSPAHYGAAALVSRAVKQEPNQPNSPRNRNATPPPSNASSSPASSTPTTSTPNSQGLSNSMERKQLQERIGQGGTPGQGEGFNFPSPQPHSTNSASTTPISPAGNIGETNPARPASKFRYPSGPTAVQNLSPGGESTSTSAMSSREGTPGPPSATPAPRHSWAGDDASGPAPNVDISSVQVKEEFGVHNAMRYAAHLNSTTAHTPHHDDYSRRPLVNIAHYPSPAPPISSHMDMYGYGSYHGGMPQQVALPPRSLHGMRPGAGLHPGFPGAGIPGRPLSLPGNSESSSHSNVKIGRRPAHLPKVLKFSDNTLPHGWLRKLKQRKHGKQAGRWDVYIYSPCGVKFASRKKLRNFFEKNNLQYDPEDFDFTPYGRHIEAGGGGGHGRHHSSSDGGGGRHAASSCSPSSVPSPSSSSFSHQPHHSEYKTEFIPPPTPVPQPAHRPYPSPYLHHGHPGIPHQPRFSDYNPMMESPPNANALQVPQHQILNLSQDAMQANNSQHQRTSATPLPPAHNTSTVSSFPPDIANILSEPNDSQFRQSLREYQSDLSTSRTDNPAAPATEEGMHVDGDKEAKEDSRFMGRAYNLLTASQGDLGEMMDEYSIYPE